ncbi:MAG TPA: helix-turn-helix domain-containing protein [Caulobacteraceae bacterium]
MHRIGLVVSPGFDFLSVAALTVFEVANYLLQEPAYALTIVSEAGGPVASSLGNRLETEPMTGQSFDTVIFAAAVNIAPSPAVTAFARDALTTARRVASICCGALALAEAGLLNERRATTHWIAAQELRRRFPRVKLDEDKIFIIDGPIWTSAGATAGIDLALAMLERDHGPEIARHVAKRLVIYHRRAGGQTQHSALLEVSAKSDRIQTALSYARQNLDKPLSVSELASAANLSPRQFTRAFRAETGQPPAKAIENLRVEAARLMMEQTRHTVDFIATETGFADRARMRRAFIRAFDQPPQVIRRNAKLAAAS